MRIETREEGVGEVELGLEEQNGHRLEAQVDEHAIWHQLVVVLVRSLL